MVESNPFAASRILSMQKLTLSRSAGRLGIDLALGVSVFAILFYCLVRRDLHEGGVLELGASEVAVQLDHGRGNQRILTEPGTYLVIPWLQEVHRFTRRPFQYRLEGNAPADLERGPRLLVRARDGASYSIDSVTVQAALDPALAPLVLADSGDMQRARGLVGTFLRTSLVQAFGAFTTEQILAPDARELAVQEARNTLEQKLARHGILLLELQVGSPSFSDKVTQTITRRQVAEQDTDRLLAQAQELTLESSGLQEELERHKELELAQLRSKLASDLAKAKLDAQRARGEALGAAQAKIQSGDLLRAKRIADASRLEDQHEAEAKALAEEVSRLQQWGSVAVRAALIERLDGLKVNLKSPVTTNKEVQ